MQLQNFNLLTAFGIIEKFYWKITLVNETEDTYIPIKDLSNERYRCQSFKEMWNKICDKYVDKAYAAQFLDFMQSDKDESYMIYQRKLNEDTAWMLIEKYKVDNDNYLYCLRAVSEDIITLIFNNKKNEIMANTDCITGFKNLTAYRSFKESNDMSQYYIIVVHLKGDNRIKGDESYTKVLASYMEFANKFKYAAKNCEVFNGPTDYFIVLYHGSKHDIISKFDSLQEKMYEYGYDIEWTYIM